MPNCYKWKPLFFHGVVFVRLWVCYFHKVSVYEGFLMSKWCLGLHEVVWKYKVSEL